MNRDENRELWEKCKEFHGHECGGLTIGYKASLLVMDLFDLSEREDSRLICISENDACGVDAIQVLLGCSVGKGNLLFHMCGKQAFSFYDKKTGKSVRLVLKSAGKMSKAESFAYYQSCSPEDMFTVMETRIPLPCGAKLFDSYTCELCGETTGANWIRIKDGKKVCLDCYEKYDRFNV